MYYRNADVIVLVYDVTSVGSFNNLKSWYSEIVLS